MRLDAEAVADLVNPAWAIGHPLSTDDAVVGVKQNHRRPFVAIPHLTGVLHGSSAEPNEWIEPIHEAPRCLRRSPENLFHFRFGNAEPNAMVVARGDARIMVHTRKHEKSNDEHRGRNRED